MCITTSHSLAIELLNKPDGFITATIGEEEYVIEVAKRKPTHANYDDEVMHWTLFLKKSDGRNIIR